MLPSVLTPSEIKVLLDRLAPRERTLVLLAASTGLRQSKLFGLKWSDIDFDLRAMSVTRSVVFGVVGHARQNPLKNQHRSTRSGRHSEPQEKILARLVTGCDPQ